MKCYRCGLSMQGSVLGLSSLPCRCFTQYAPAPNAAPPPDGCKPFHPLTAVDSVLAGMEHNKAQHDAMVMDAERYRWLLSRLKAYDMDGPALLFSWPAGVAFNFGAPTDSIDAARAGQAELVLHNDRNNQLAEGESGSLTC